MSDALMPFIVALLVLAGIIGAIGLIERARRPGEPEMDSLETLRREWDKRVEAQQRRTRERAGSPSKGGK